MKLILQLLPARYLLRDFVLRYLTNNFPKWGAIDRALEREGWKLVTMLRLSPIVPWNILNYALAVTSVPVWPYALASSLAVRVVLGTVHAMAWAGTKAASAAHDVLP